MKLKYTCVIYLLLISFFSYSQPNKTNTTIPKKAGSASTQSHSGTSDTKKRGNAATNAATVAYSSPLTGVWRGFFTSGSGFFQEKYRYEVQIGQLQNNGVKGVTYSYKTTVFYGKASLVGMYTPSTRNLVLKENRLVEVKMSGGEACLMTCYLEYTRVGNTEVLEGTFTSINLNTKTDCGSGRVYLEKVPESDFYKEDFLKDYEVRKRPPVVPSTPKVEKKKPEEKPKPRTTEEEKPKRKPVEKEDIVKKDPPKIAEPTTGKDRKIDEPVLRPVESPRRHVPKELTERENKIAKTIEAEGSEITIELYDNGQIDDDTVTIIHNKQVVAARKRLCHQPIVLKIKVDPNKTRNEFVMIAENLGSIPPNTALMVITVGKQRHEVTITSTEQKNAVVVVNCRVPEADDEDSKK